MPELNTLNYFAIILTGFSVVWSYRYFTGQRDKQISEFEYAALSAIWGIPIGILILGIAYFLPDAGKLYDGIPMIATITFLPIGIAMGWAGAQFKNRK